MLLRMRRRDSKKLALPSNSPNRFPKTKDGSLRTKWPSFLFNSRSLFVGARTCRRYDKSVIPLRIICQKRSKLQVPLVLLRAICICNVAFFVVENCHEKKFIWILAHLEIIVCHPTGNDCITETVHRLDELIFYTRLNP